MEIGLDWWFCWITQRENYICVSYSCILKKKKLTFMFSLHKVQVVLNKTSDKIHSSCNMINSSLWCLPLLSPPLVLTSAVLYAIYVVLL